MSEARKITVVPFQRLGGLLQDSEGHGIFIDCGTHRMNVGAILPLPDGRYMVNVMVLAEMEVPGYLACDFSDQYDTMESAVHAALSFLASKRKGENPNAL